MWGRGGMSTLGFSLRVAPRCVAGNKPNIHSRLHNQHIRLKQRVSTSVSALCGSSTRARLFSWSRRSTVVRRENGFLVRATAPTEEDISGTDGDAVQKADNSAQGAEVAKEADPTRLYIGSVSWELDAHQAKEGTSGYVCGDNYLRAKSGTT
eukprot:9467837-Pyramimonas_sp.AAC.1